MIAQAAVRVLKGVDAGLLGAPLLPHPRVDEDAVLADLEIEAARGETDPVGVVRGVRARPQRLGDVGEHRPAVQAEVALRERVKDVDGAIHVSSRAVGEKAWRAYLTSPGFEEGEARGTCRRDPGRR